MPLLAALVLGSLPAHALDLQLQPADVRYTLPAADASANALRQARLSGCELIRKPWSHGSAS